VKGYLQPFPAWITTPYADEKEGPLSKCLPVEEKLGCRQAIIGLQGPCP